MLDCSAITQFFQAGVSDGVGHLAARRAQGVGRQTQIKALTPFAQSRAGLIIDFIGDQRASVAVIVVIPEIDLFLQGSDFVQGAGG